MISNGLLIDMSVEINGMEKTEVNMVADSHTDWKEVLISGGSLIKQTERLQDYDCEHAFIMVIIIDD